MIFLKDFIAIMKFNESLETILNLIKENDSKKLSEFLRKIKNIVIIFIYY